MKSFPVRVIASNKIFYEGDCTYLVIPESTGQKAFMADHETVAVAIVMGKLKITKPDGEVIEALVGNGFAHVRHGAVTVLVDTAERPEDIDIIRAEEAKHRAEERLRQKMSSQEYHHSAAALARAMERLKATQNYNKHRI
jgi:F-type H+-transporting ATPase subunit epsilon